MPKKKPSPKYHLAKPISSVSRHRPICKCKFMFVVKPEKQKKEKGRGHRKQCFALCGVCPSLSNRNTAKDPSKHALHLLDLPSISFHAPQILGADLIRKHASTSATGLARVGVMTGSVHGVLF